jgi:molybdenum-dependent DNA-binding transcriptional regulator ModE
MGEEREGGRGRGRGASEKYLEKYIESEDKNDQILEKALLNSFVTLYLDLPHV